MDLGKRTTETVVLNVRGITLMPPFQFPVPIGQMFRTVYPDIKSINYNYNNKPHRSKRGIIRLYGSLLRKY